MIQLKLRGYPVHIKIYYCFREVYSVMKARQVGRGSGDRERYGTFSSDSIPAGILVLLPVSETLVYVTPFLITIGQ